MLDEGRLVEGGGVLERHGRGHDDLRPHRQDVVVGDGVVVELLKYLKFTVLCDTHFHYHVYFMNFYAMI